MTDDIFTRKALEGLDGKTVPVVTYDSDGTREVIGEGTLRTVSGGLQLEGHISDEAYQALFSQVRGTP